MIRIACLLVLAISLNTKMYSQDIFSIKFVYGNEETSLPLVASCTVESFSFCFEDELNFLTTHDKQFINQFSILYKELKLKNKNDSLSEINPQIMSIIYYDDESIPNDTVCFGKKCGICKNSVILENDKTLLTLIKKKIGWKDD